MLNKWEMVDERKLEDVEDKILDLDVEPPIPRQKSSKGWVDKNIIFGLDAKLAKAVEQPTANGSAHEHNHNHSSEVEVLSITLASKDKNGSVDIEKLSKLLEDPTKDEVYRIKGVLYASTPPQSSDKDISTSAPVSGRGRYILNWAFGRWMFTHVPETSPTGGESEPELRLTVVTARYESNKWKKQIESSGLISLRDGMEGDLTVEKKA